MRVLLKFIALLLFGFSSFMIYDYYYLHQPSLYPKLERIDPLPHTRKLVKEGRLNEASEYLGFFMDYEYVKSNPKARRLYEEIEQKRHTMEYQSKKALEGVLMGKSDEPIGEASAMVSDFFLFGDLRDLAIEGYHKVSGQKVDEVLVGLSTIGVISSGATLLSGGSIAPIKGGIGSLKLLKRKKRMPKWVERFIVIWAKQIKKTKNIKPITNFFEDIYHVTKASGFSTTIRLLKTTKSAKAFRESVSFAKTFGKRGNALFMVLGKDTYYYYKLLKPKLSKRTFMLASTYGKAALKRALKLGEKGFLRSLKPLKRVSRLSKVLNKHSVKLLHSVSVKVYMLIATVSLLFLV